MLPALEHRRAPLLSTGAFLLRLLRFAAASAVIVLVSLALGALGYHALAGLEWVDAFLNAAMILTGMGPVDAMRTPAAKLFATFYALYSGVAFLTTAAVLITPVAHRLLHHFHLELDEDDG
jgi:hypothetical protein